MQRALRQIYNITAGTIDAAEYLIYILELLPLKNSCFLSLLESK